MKIVGMSFCPSDAHQNILNIANHILVSKGGYGVIRELYDMLIKNNYHNKTEINEVK